MDSPVLTHLPATEYLPTMKYLDFLDYENETNGTYIEVRLCDQRWLNYEILTNTIKDLPKCFQVLPKWWNFAKSGHTGHTNKQWFCYKVFCFKSFQYGTLESLGTVDFYPGYNNEYYGCYQPGCYDVVDVVSCSHSRSHQVNIGPLSAVWPDLENFCTFDKT